jgi:hypothetical protein
MAQSMQQEQHPADSSDIVEEAQWALYEEVMDAAAGARIPFAIGGAFGLATYTGIQRNTKDLDLYVLPPDRARAIDVVSRLGLTDYFDRVPYDRDWIYRATRGGMIVDIIWAMANQRAEVDGWWMSGPLVQLRGRRVKVLPPEAILWDKLYIMQRERCDWPDVLNLLYCEGQKLEWEELLKRLGDDLPLLSGALAVFRWISPGAAAKLPDWLWPAVHLPSDQNGSAPEIVPERVAWLDTRPWFARKPGNSHNGSRR